MSINILKNARIRNGYFCKFDSNEGYSVSWDEDDNFKGYTVYEDLTARLVVNGSYFMVTTSSGCSITTAADIDEIDAGVYSHLKISMRVEVEAGTSPPTNGRVDFRTADDVTWVDSNRVEFPLVVDNSYREYTIDMSQIYEWQGAIKRLRINPIVDDGTAGIKVFLRYVKVISQFNYNCGTAFNSPLCSRFTDYYHPCPFIGAGAKVTGASVSQRLTIEAGVNDKLVVNINSFGNQAITLEPVVGGDIEGIARDIEYKLNLVGVGGYSNSLCYIEGLSFVIESDTPSSESVIVITEPSAASAAATLGFFTTTSGSSSYISEFGEDAASRYESESTFKVSRDALDRFIKEDKVVGETVFSIDPTKYSPQGGRSDYIDIVRDSKLEFRYKTFIDYNNPITENGVLVKAYFSGDAHTETEFRVYRQRLDGSIYYVYGINFGSSRDNNLSKIFEVDCLVRVQKGDLIGLYSASLHTGGYGSAANFSYYLYDGDLSVSSDIQKLEGFGEDGAALFCRGTEKTDNAVVSILFDVETSVESITIEADEETTDEIIPLTSLQSGGLNGGPYITGYTGYGTDGTKAPEWTGLSYLTDGLKLDVNSTSPSAYPLWWGGGNHPNYEFTEAGFKLDFCPGVNVFFDIYKVSLYFKTATNIKSFSIDYPYSTNLLDTLQEWHPVTSRFSEVYTDGFLEETSRYLYSNPAYVPVTRYYQDYVQLVYRTLTLEFTPIKARSLRYRGYLDINDPVISDYNSDSLGLFAIYLDPNIQEIEVFAKSTPSKNLSDNFEIRSSENSEDFVIHTDIDSLSSSTTRFIVGYPVKELKLVIKPNSLLDVKDIILSTPQGNTRIDTDTFRLEQNISPPINNPSSVINTITVTNESEEESTYYIDISDEDNKAENCILWNKLDSENNVQNSEIGPGGILYKRDNFNLSVGNIALDSPAYVLEPNFLRGVSPCYLSYDGGLTWANQGDRFVDGNKLSYVTNESTSWEDYPVVYVAIDCVNFYDFISVAPISKPYDRFDVGWDTTIYFSNMDVSDPSLIPDSDTLDPNRWMPGQLTNVRWMRLQSNATWPGAGQYRTTTFAYIRAILDIESSRNKSNGFVWLSESRLTNGLAGTSTGSPEGSWAGPNKSYYHCVDLEGQFNITKVNIGPGSCPGNSTNGRDFGTCNSLNGSLINSDIAFSNDLTSDPAKVRWRAFGTAPIGSDRWILFRGDVCDEISVFVDDSTSLTKPLYEVTKYWSSNGTTIYVDNNDYCSIPGGSIAMNYSGSTRIEEKIRLDVNLGHDSNLAARDALAFCLYIEDVSQLDSNVGYIKVGRNEDETFSFNGQVSTVDESNYFMWPINTFYSSLVSGWNSIFLPFGLDNKVGEPNFTINLTGLSYTSNQKRSRMTNFEFLFRGVSTDSSFTLKIDSLEILRTYYPPSEFGYGLYLVDDEYAKFNLNAVNPIKGCIEFFLDPDWAKSTSCNTCKDIAPHTVFRLLNNQGFLIECLMTTDGASLFFEDGNITLHHMDNSLKEIPSGSRTHFAFSWNFEDGSPSAFEMYIDGELSFEFPASSLSSTFDVRRHSNIYLIFGGRAWNGNADNEITGLNGVIDNVKIFNYYKRDFSDSLANEAFPLVKKARDMIDISIDGVNYYGYEDRGSGLPVFKRNVQSGDSFDVYLRAKDISDTQDVENNRKSYIEVVRVKE
jgi:hypothetical protein